MTYKIDLLIITPLNEVIKGTEINQDKLNDRIISAAYTYYNSQEGGYFPALGTLLESEYVNLDNKEQIEKLSWNSSRYARQKLTRGLAEVFSQISIKKIRPIAFDLPRITASTSNSEIKSVLCTHYKGNQLRVSIELKQLMKKQTDMDMSDYVRKILWKWLKNDFEDMQVLLIKYQ